MLHHIQRSVIDVLAGMETARYGDLKPADLDGNQFTYHLKQLVSAKLVVQNDDGTYSLTKSGRSYLVHRYEDEAESAHTIFLLVVRSGDKLLLRKRLVQPALGHVGFIHGEPLASEPLEQTIRDRFKLKTGLDTPDITIHASGLIRMTKSDEIESFSHAIIASMSLPSDDLPIGADATGENFWVTESELANVSDLLPSCVDIITLVSEGGSWFDWSYDVS